MQISLAASAPPGPNWGSSHRALPRPPAGLGGHFSAETGRRR